MHRAVMISFATCGVAFSTAWADEPLVRVDLAVGSHTGYIVPGVYAWNHQADLEANIPGSLKIDSFWTPSLQDVAVADRVLQDLISDASKDPALLFPDLAPKPNSAAPPNPEAARVLEEERSELALVSDNYDYYVRQYVGIVVDGRKLIFCNYSAGTKADPADYIFIDKVFVPDGTVHFLQCRFDPLKKTCSNVSMIGSWEQKEK